MSMESAVLAAKAKMMQAGDDGVSIHDHIAATVAKIITDEPENPLAMFEQISLAVKKQNVLPRKEYLEKTPEPPAPALVKKRDLFRAKPEMPEDAEFPNVVEELSFFEAAGHGLTRDEAFTLKASMAKLTADKGLRTIRFFGKVFGTESDYYILEGAYAEDPEEEEPEEGAPEPDPKAIPAEENGTGVNKFRFWVCNELGEDWVELPAAKPDAIVAARSMNKYFTGNLDAKIVTHPPFPGTERDYLRAQIARILHDTYVAPGGMFSAEEDTEEVPPPIAPTEEWEAPEPEEMAEPSAWVHYYSTILKMGRVSKPPKEEEEEEEEEDELGPTSTALTALAHDAADFTQQAESPGPRQRLCPLCPHPAAEEYLQRGIRRSTYPSSHARGTSPALCPLRSFKRQWAANQSQTASTRHGQIAAAETGQVVPHTTPSSCPLRSAEEKHPWSTSSGPHSRACARIFPPTWETLRSADHSVRTPASSSADRGSA
eukprot:CAMPEP_0185183540 /NCGR_PEP_ID=MMETSP1140-20130426/2049_1 /TAXON_ID=298111 /ORGANISM="Pavlova sp., Strain CCMP459" /LENGTH=486 /DNA_ID=CAMNT_0027749561 /DNA_START=28 /DNA_END=1486 /DNA_ORIENTATION=+